MEIRIFYKGVPLGFASTPVYSKGVSLGFVWDYAYFTKGYSEDLHEHKCISKGMSFGLVWKYAYFKRCTWGICMEILEIHGNAVRMHQNALKLIQNMFVTVSIRIYFDFKRI